MGTISDLDSHNSDDAETRSTCLAVRQKDNSRSGKQRKSMLLFAAFQAHLSKLMLKIYGNRNFQWSTRGKDRYCLFLVKYSPEGGIFVVCDTKDFCPRTFGEYELAI